MTFGLGVDPLVLVAAGLLVLGVLSSAFATRMRLPGLLLFLALGMVIGDDGLGLLSLDDPGVAQTAGVLALLLILFEGGLTTRPADLRRAAVPGFALATVGVVLTTAVVAVGAIVFTGLDVLTALLIGAVVSSTDAAAVFSVLRRSPLPRRITALLEVESGANDPMAILLTIGLLETWRAQPGVTEWLVFGARQLGGGVVGGVVVGVVGAWLLRRIELGAAGLYPVLALGLAGVAYGAAAAAGASGFLAVYVCGLMIGARVPRYRRGIRTFHEGLANIAEIGLFLLLGLLVFPSQLPAVILPALGVTAVLVLVARPFAVHATMIWPLLRRRWDMRELGLVSWSGLRGAVPIVLATFPLTAQYPDGVAIFNIVFFVVLVSTAVQGSTIGLVARRLGLVKEDATIWAPIAEILPLEGADIDLVEVDVTDHLHIAGRQLRDVPLPHGARLTAIIRNERTIVPHGSTRLLPGDRALVTAPRDPRAAERVTIWATGEEHTGDHPVAEPY
ncbi:potassium/proton antiporter [soil metagenome]